MDAENAHYPNRLVRALLLALEATAGPSSVASALRIAGIHHVSLEALPPEDMAPCLSLEQVAAFNHALESLYGVRGGHGIALRAGTPFFEMAWQGFGPMAAIDTAAFRQLPTDVQARFSLVVLAWLLTTYAGQWATLTTTPDAFVFTLADSPFGAGRVNDKPVCHWMVGTLQATLRHATNGYAYAVHETACQATGAESCVFDIRRQPIGRMESD